MAQVDAEAVKKVAGPLPISLVALVLALGGGGAGVGALLGGGGEDIEAHERREDARWADYRREADARYASKSDVATMSGKLDTVLDRIGEMREELQQMRYGVPAPLRRSDP
jgi:hypothetical protein